MRIKPPCPPSSPHPSSLLPPTPTPAKKPTLKAELTKAQGLPPLPSKLYLFCSCILSVRRLTAPSPTAPGRAVRGAGPRRVRAGGPGGAAACVGGCARRRGAPGGAGQPPAAAAGGAAARVGGGRAAGGRAGAGGVCVCVCASGRVVCGLAWCVVRSCRWRMGCSGRTGTGGSVHGRCVAGCCEVRYTACFRAN